MTMAKATTNGISPLGVVACKEEIYDALMDNAPKGTIELFSWLYLLRNTNFCCSRISCARLFLEKDDYF